jgi:hypothetical protein
MAIDYIFSTADAMDAQPKKDVTTPDHKMSEIYVYANLSKYEGLRGSLAVRAPTIYVGVEIELEKVKLNTNIPSSFEMKHDGSLKLDGKEFVTVPIRVCYLEQELRRLFACMPPPLISPRCSIHVHLNARDFTSQELYRFLLLYLIFERSLFHFSGGRLNNIFCSPLHEDIDKVKAEINKLYAHDGVRLMGWSKYFALNLVPLWGSHDESARIGTVEFRHMAGTTDVEHIIEWINLIVGLKISAKKMDTQELVKSLGKMNTTSSYNHLVTEVFKDWAVHLLSQPTFKEDVEHGVLMAKMTLPIKNGEKVKTEIEIPMGYKGDNACVA